MCYFHVGVLIIPSHSAALTRNKVYLLKNENMKKDPEDRLFSKTSPKPPCYNIEIYTLVTVQRTVLHSRYEVAETWLLHAFNYFLKYSHSLFLQGKKNSSFLNSPPQFFPTTWREFVLMCSAMGNTSCNILLKRQSI